MNYSLKLFQKIIKLPQAIEISENRLVESSINFFLVLEKDNVISYGEAAPMIQGLEEKIMYGNLYQTVKSDLIFLIDNFNLSSITFSDLERLHSDFCHLSSESLACFDMLLHDYLAKTSGETISKLYTHSSENVSIIPCVTGAEKNDYGLLKKKVTDISKKDILNNIERLDNIILDFNSSYKNYNSFYKDFSILFKANKNIIFEEPCSLSKLKPENITHIVVDDSFCDKTQILNPVFINSNIGLNFKIQKIGGIYPCVSIAQKYPDRQYMIGCNLETSLSICASAHLTQILSRICSKNIISDLDSDIHLGLDNKSPLVTPNGRKPVNDSGLGYCLEVDNTFEFIHEYQNKSNQAESLLTLSVGESIYDRHAHNYEEIINSPHVHANIATYISKLIYKYNIKPKNILDLGCGPGNLSKLFGDKVLYTGVDISTKMLTLAEKVGYQTIQGDIKNILDTIPDKKFDYIFAMSSLQFVEDIESTIENLNRIASKGWIITLDNISSELISIFRDQENLQMYNHFKHPIMEISEDIYINGWKSATTNQVIQCRICFKDLTENN